jgi:2-polyprenyl-6-methoxyphenol hydroxylase-like FAD-dependent oxidoreductase
MVGGFGQVRHLSKSSCRLLIAYRCLPYLEGLVPDDLEPFESASANYGREGDDGFTILDGSSHKILGTVLLGSKDSVNGGIFVSRNKLREVLARYLTIQHNKRFSCYEEDSNGVTVGFKDGSTARGTILVGADGASSAVRS